MSEKSERPWTRADLMAVKATAPDGFTTVDGETVGRMASELERLEGLLRAGDAALEAAGVANDGSAIATRIGVLGERCEKAETAAGTAGERVARLERRLEERTAARDEAWKELQARDRELADAKAAFERERTELFQERAVILRLKKDREDARRERDAAQADLQKAIESGQRFESEVERLTARLGAETARANLIQVHREQAEREIAEAREQFGVPRPVLTEEQAREWAERLATMHDDRGSFLGEDIDNVTAALLCASKGDFGAEQSEAPAPKDEQASAKPFPMPGTRWRFHGNELAPPMAGSRVVSGLRWSGTSVEAVFTRGTSCASVRWMMTLDAWEFLGSEDAPKRDGERICEACRKGDDGFGWYRHASHAGVRHRGCAVDGSESARGLEEPAKWNDAAQIDRGMHPVDPCEGCAKVARHPGEGYACARHPEKTVSVRQALRDLAVAVEGAQAEGNRGSGKETRLRAAWSAYLQAVERS